MVHSFVDKICFKEWKMWMIIQNGIHLDSKQVNNCYWLLAIGIRLVYWTLNMIHVDKGLMIISHYYLKWNETRELKALGISHFKLLQFKFNKNEDKMFSYFECTDAHCAFELYYYYLLLNELNTIFHFQFMTFQFVRNILSI